MQSKSEASEDEDPNGEDADEGELVLVMEDNLAVGPDYFKEASQCSLVRNSQGRLRKTKQKIPAMSSDVSRTKPLSPIAYDREEEFHNFEAKKLKELPPKRTFLSLGI
ncbi:hypothetical protein NDU88_001083 [Pleurodeles waltl]|uniref:Uncharacterized protein n=1 Tax=Pleurodeles waltl TaxID=8319 RepID=A0AAV7WL48_PLEWA|nr:hypothetical protein NDU88_001083 [Pleurodeles waltl]